MANNAEYSKLTEDKQLEHACSRGDEKYYRLLVTGGIMPEKKHVLLLLRGCTKETATDETEREYILRDILFRRLGDKIPFEKGEILYETSYARVMRYMLLMYYTDMPTFMGSCGTEEYIAHMQDERILGAAIEHKNHALVRALVQEYDVINSYKLRLLLNTKDIKSDIIELAIGKHTGDINADFLYAIKRKYPSSILPFFRAGCTQYYDGLVYLARSYYSSDVDQFLYFMREKGARLTPDELHRLHQIGNTVWLQYKHILENPDTCVIL